MEGEDGQIGDDHNSFLVQDDVVCGKMGTQNVRAKERGDIYESDLASGHSRRKGWMGGHEHHWLPSSYSGVRNTSHMNIAHFVA